jgi:hypothetical protein
MFQLMNNTTDIFLNLRIGADRELAANYFAVPGQQVANLPRGFENYYLAAAEGAVPTTISYDADNDQYSGYMTLFTQSLLSNKDDGGGVNPNRLKYLALMPVNPSAPRSLTRTIFHKDNVKLRIFYTRAKTANP